jgi:hypothetical protein
MTYLGSGLKEIRQRLSDRLQSREIRRRSSETAVQNTEGNIQNGIGDLQNSSEGVHRKPK